MRNTLDQALGKLDTQEVRGRGGAAWRGRVRTTLDQALGKVDTGGEGEGGGQGGGGGGAPRWTRR